MIKVNFAGQEIAGKKQRHFRRGVVAAYILAWLISGAIGFVRFEQNQNARDRVTAQIGVLQTKMEQIQPEFEQASQVFEELKEKKAIMTEQIGHVVSGEFVLASLTQLSRHTPHHIWYDAIEFTRPPKSAGEMDGTDDEGESAWILRLHGNLIPQGETGGTTQGPRSLLRKMGAVSPFNLAAHRIDYSEMEMKKLGGQFYHTFVAEFVWPGVIL